MATKKVSKKMEMGVTMEQLLEAGAHFGHQVRRWNPRMKKFIWQARGGVHIFDLEKSVEYLNKASEALAKYVGEGKKVLVVGTKPQAKAQVREMAEKLGLGYVSERWLGGTLSNWTQIKSRLDRMNKLKLDREAGKFAKYVKKERLLLDREIDKLSRFFGGLNVMKGLPEVIVIIDTHKEKVAVREAKGKGIKIIGIVDTNSDPEGIDFPIPMNDDSAAAIKIVLDALAMSVEKAKKVIKTDAKK